MTSLMGCPGWKSFIASGFKGLVWLSGAKRIKADGKNRAEMQAEINALNLAKNIKEMFGSGGAE